MAAYRGSRLGYIGAALVASLATLTPAVPASASTPALMWTGAKRLNLLCNVAGGPGVDHVALSAQLCREVARLAAKGAPVPVRTISLGDPAVLGGDGVTLLVHASVTYHKGERLLAFSIRPYRVAAAQADVLFGSVPRAARLGPSLASPALEAAVAAALSETLPWLARSESGRRF